MANVTVTFLDVGQGDCTVVVDHESRSAMLIDCPRGSDAAAAAEIQSHRAVLDTVVVTHSHLDHLGGVLDVIETLGCSRVFYNHDTLIAHATSPVGDVRQPNSALKASLRRMLELQDDQLAPAVPGATGQVGEARFSFLAPSHRDLTRAVVTGRANAGSGIVVIEVDQVRLLVGGDADVQVWARLLRNRRIPQAAVVRWPHHGADLDAVSPGLTEAILDELDPSVVAVSVGAENIYGHPADSFLTAIRPRKTTLMCTEATSKCAGQNPQACAAAIRVRIINNTVVMDPCVEDHYARVGLLPTPMCLGPTLGMGVG